MISLARPVGEEVRLGLRRLLLTGAFSPGERLPDPGSLSVALGVNRYTVLGACTALAEEGLLRAEGEGYIAAPPDEPTRREVLGRFDGATRELLILGFSGGELKERVTALEEERARERGGEEG